MAKNITIGMETFHVMLFSTIVVISCILIVSLFLLADRTKRIHTLTYERNKYYQTLLSIGDGVMVIGSGRDIEFMNPVACRLTGWTLEEAAGMNYKEVFILSHEEEGHTVTDTIEKIFATGKARETGDNVVLISKGGEKYHLEDNGAAILDDAGRVGGVVLVFRDVTGKKKRQREIEYISSHDSLTGLYNRCFFEEKMHHMDTKAHLPISILMGDVNSLKLANDIFGHASGDMLLKKASEAMRKVSRDGDIIARWGGDEFVLLLPKTDGEEAEQIAKRIKGELSTQKIHSVRSSISIGHATKTESDGDIAEVLRNAEVKMYNIKSVERNDTQSLELKMMLDALFAKSDWEKQHAVRARDMCGRLGQVMKMSQSDISKLKSAAYLHDIGKAVVGSDVLQNDGTFNTVEISDVKLHPAVGYRILSYFDTTVGLAGIILAHHERWDGSGYPKGLCKEEIPLKARIITVVEAYDRMTNTIDDSRAKSHNEALEEIRSCAGTQFDPCIAEIFINMFQEDESQK